MYRGMNISMYLLVKIRQRSWWKAGGGTTAEALTRFRRKRLMGSGAKAPALNLAFAQTKHLLYLYSNLIGNHRDARPPPAA